MSNKRKEVATDILFFLAVALIAFIVSLKFSILHVNGYSMYPTYEDKDIVMLNKKLEFNTGDIAIFNPPESWRSENDKFIKRIIALEGDKVHVDNDTLSVNGEFISNITHRNCGLEEPKEFQLNKNEVFMMGDNQVSSNDSLQQLCNENDEFLIDENEVSFKGKEIYVITGGFFQWLN